MMTAGISVGPRVRVRCAGLFVSKQLADTFVYKQWDRHPDIAGHTIKMHQPDLGAARHLRQAIVQAIEQQFLPKVDDGDELDLLGHSLGAIVLGALVGFRYAPQEMLHPKFRPLGAELKRRKLEVGHYVSECGPWSGHALARAVSELIPIKAPITGVRCLTTNSRIILEIIELLEWVALHTGVQVWFVWTNHDSLVARESALPVVPGAWTHVVQDAPWFSHFRPWEYPIVRDLNAICYDVPLLQARMTPATAPTVQVAAVAA